MLQQTAEFLSKPENIGYLKLYIKMHGLYQRSTKYEQTSERASSYLASISSVIFVL